MGILQSSSIWATHSLYQNDSRELFHGLDQAINIVGAIFKEDLYRGAFALTIALRMGNVNPENIFITSFSEKPDLLSQWRGYCPPGAGLCLGFDLEKMKNFCTNQGFRLEKCIYKDAEQISLISSLMKECFEKFPQPNITQEHFNQLSQMEQVEIRNKNFQNILEDLAASKEAQRAIEWIKSQFIEVAPLFKNEGFHEEEEWRIIADSPQIPKKFRVVKTYLAPFIDLLILGEGNNGVLKEVIVGPNPNQQRCTASVEEFLKENGFTDVDVRKSVIPFNSW